MYTLNIAEMNKNHLKIGVTIIGKSMIHHGI